MRSTSATYARNVSRTLLTSLSLPLSRVRLSSAFSFFFRVRMRARIVDSADDVPAVLLKSARTCCQRSDEVPRGQASGMCVVTGKN